MVFHTSNKGKDIKHTLKGPFYFNVLFTSLCGSGKVCVLYFVCSAHSLKSMYLLLLCLLFPLLLVNSGSARE